MSQQAYFFKKYPKLTLVIVSFLLFLLVLFTVEGILRFQGQQAGIISTTGFKKVEKLEIYENYATGEDGIMRMDPNIKEYVDDWFLKNGYKTMTKDDWWTLVEGQKPSWKFGLIENYYTAYHGEINNEFSQWIQKLKNKPKNQLSEVEEAYLHYCLSPINEDGFKTIPFKYYDSELPKVLILGDSFAWGRSNRNLTNSFADILAARGFTIFNTGINAADPAQYATIAEQYIPQLQPDIVLVNLFLGNDITYFKRELRPHLNLLTESNAGALYACPHGIYFDTPEAIYQFILRQAQIPNMEINRLNRWCAKTALTTRMWQALVKAGILEDETDAVVAEYWKKVEANQSPKAVTGDYLEKIRQVCEANNSQFVLSVIPDVVNLGKDVKEQYPEVFENFSYFVPDNLDVQHYKGTTSGAHFNETGHGVYADFLEKVLRTF